MRKISIGVMALGLSLMLNSATAITNPALKPSFADLTWYSNHNAVKQQMRVKGYIFEGDIASSGAIDSSYSGQLLGLPVSIRHWFNSNKQLAKTTVIFRNQYGTNLYSSWKTIKASVDGKYGKGLDLTNVSSLGMQEFFMLDDELESGKQISNFWIFPTYKYGIFLNVEKAYTNDSKNYVILSYESPNWAQEITRRQKSSDF
jgi:hypothetical protein